MRLPEKKNGSRAFLFFSIYIYIALSILFILVNDAELTSDARFYNDKAEECLRLKTFYPGLHNEYDDYVQNPGYVNYLILLKNLGFSLKGNYTLNILLNIALLLISYFIAKQIFGYPLHPLIFIFVIYPRNYATNVGLYSELLFAVLAYLALLLFLKGRQVGAFFSGFVLAIANFVRPEAIIFVLSLLIYSLLNKIVKARYLQFIGSFLCCVLLIGLVTYQSSGHFIFQSMTGGINLLVGANPDANGSSNNAKVLFQEGKIGYFPGYSSASYIEKNSYWMSQAFDWIKQNPLRYTGLFVRKIYYTFYRDSWGINRLANTNLPSRHIRHLSPVKRTIWFLFQVINQTIYMAIVLLAVYSTKYLISKKSSWILFLIVIGGGVLIGILYGDSRIKYFMIPAFLVLASYSTDSLMIRCKQRLGKTPVGINR